MDLTKEAFEKLYEEFEKQDFYTGNLGKDLVMIFTKGAFEHHLEHFEEISNEEKISMFVVISKLLGKEIPEEIVEEYKKIRGQLIEKHLAEEQSERGVC